MTELIFRTDKKFPQEMDEKDPLASYRDLFHIPKTLDQRDCIYLAGNSLGLQPCQARKYIERELEDWAKLGVEGHLHAKVPWFSYHETVAEQTARLVGAKPIEVVVMNTLSVNLHLMMVSFYRPTQKRYKILIESNAFPSDQYAVASQARFHGFDPKEAILELKPRPGEITLRNEDILQYIQENGSSIALILLGNVNYLTGQAFDIPSITHAGHAQGCLVGFDLAHGVGNLHLNLHEWGPDFAVWCSYKYLNGGPGSLSGCFIHERHSNSPHLPRFAGWWGQNKKTRFQMGPDFDPIPGAEGWQLSNPPIFQLAALRASLEIFDRATMSEVVKKRALITGYLEFLLNQLPKNYCTIITPKDPSQHGAQLSLRIRGNPKELLDRWARSGIICDFRQPDIIRVAPVALYNRYNDVFQFVQALEQDARN